MEMHLKNRSDTDALMDSLGDTSQISYIDIQQLAALQKALTHWPLLAKLRSEGAEAANKAAV